jgi:hypothetical protein
MKKLRLTLGNLASLLRSSSLFVLLLGVDVRVLLSALVLGDEGLVVGGIVGSRHGV